jgi:hypothetical protein
MKPCLLSFLGCVLFAPSLLAQDATASPPVVVEKALAAVGGKDKLLKVFRIGETFHFGDKPEPPEGKKPSSRISVIELPNLWWLGKKERGEEPAKDDVRAWSLDLLVDPKSQFDAIAEITDEGKTCKGLQVSGSVMPPMKFYFDHETHLLHRLDWRSDFYRFSDWKEHDGLRYAAKTIIFKLKDNKPWFYHEITSLERLTKLPDGLVKP